MTPHALRLAALALLALAGIAGAQVPAWRNQDLPFEERARDLVALMTLEEKVSQMMDVAPAIDRLGIPSYNWWNEALHGVARSGLATVFPQAIGLAATWDDSLIHDMAHAIADEARAKYAEYLRRGERPRYGGLTFWSPNINLFRDPRWGRGQETYGEDPYLAGRLAVQFIRGLQGSDSRYLETVATVKHFAVHSGPEPERHRFDAVIDERDLRESYLPQFAAGIREGGAASLMCAYNRVDGAAACGSDMLLRDILREEWGFTGYVVSDCGAVADIWRGHPPTTPPPAAAAGAARAGTDLNCGRTYASLVDAVRRGLVPESVIDTAVTRLFTARLRLGMFDDSARVPWSGIPYSVVDDSAHRALARRVARESIVLLRNEGGALPLSRSLGTIAVIGPNADDAQVLLGNYNGTPADPVTPLRGIREAVGRRMRVLHARGSDLVDGLPWFETVPPDVLTPRRGRRGLTREVYSGAAFEGRPAMTAVDSTLDMSWPEGLRRLGSDSVPISVRWTGSLKVPYSGVYRFGLRGNLRGRLYLDDSLVAQPADSAGMRARRGAPDVALTLTAGRRYAVRVEAEGQARGATLRLVWSRPPEALLAEALAAAGRADAVVLCLGLTSRLEGEEMRVQLDGFSGGDRTRIDLPDAQERLLERVVALGKPTVLVLLNGSALAVNWAQQHVGAILEAWYPGQAGGSAIADVLFGDDNPGGRLPVTFYRSLEDLPAFDDYAMTGRTYRFFDGSPLYPFGHGLSYTTFAYDSLRISADTVAAGDTLAVSVNVTNTGARTGDEVVQLYVQHLGAGLSRPRQDLRGYQRITLRPGETRTVVMRLPVASLAYWEVESHSWRVAAEPVRLEVGSSSADIRLERYISVVAR